MNVSEGGRERVTCTAAPEGEQGTGEVDRSLRRTLPEDVAVLFRWAGVHDMPYREFPALEPQPLEPAAGECDDGAAEVAAGVTEAPHPLNEVSHGPMEDLAASGDMRPVRLPQRRMAGFWPQGLRRAVVAEEHSVQGAGLASVAASADDPEVRDGAMAGPTPVRRGAAEGSAAPPHAEQRYAGEDGRAAGGGGAEPGSQGGAARMAAPSWLAQYTPTRRVQDETVARRTETLQTSRERVAARWFALRNLLEAPGADAQVQVDPETLRLPPMLAIYSVAGGTGRTSLAASLARALAAQGERTLLVELTGHEVLPFFFGAQGERGSEERVFAPPAGTSFAPVHLRRYALLDPEEPGREAASWIDQLQEHSRGFSRVLVDVPTAATGALRQIVSRSGRALVPLLPDMNSALSLRAVRRVFAGASPDAAAPHYLLTQFDAAERLHLDLREVLRKELGEALLPLTVRRSQLVTEALAQGMTVMDYAADAPVTQDLRDVAGWVRGLEEPHEDGIGQARWIER